MARTVGCHAAPAVGGGVRVLEVVYPIIGLQRQRPRASGQQRELLLDVGCVGHAGAERVGVRAGALGAALPRGRERHRRENVAADLRAQRCRRSFSEVRREVGWGGRGWGEGGCAHGEVVGVA